MTLQPVFMRPYEATMRRQLLLPTDVIFANIVLDFGFVTNALLVMTMVMKALNIVRTMIMYSSSAEKVHVLLHQWWEGIDSLLDIAVIYNVATQ